MKKIFIISTLCIALCCFFTSCKKDKKEDNQTKTVAITEANLHLIKSFGENITNTILKQDPDFFNNSIDTGTLKNLAIQKSSSVTFGKGPEIFSQNSRYGDYLLSIVNNGGDFRIDTCYVKNGRYHLLLRIYNQYGGIEFEDLQINMRGNSPVVEDAFIYTIAGNLSDKIASEASFSAFMSNENPTDAARNMLTVTALYGSGDFAQMWQILRDNRTQLKEFTAFYNFYPIGLYQFSDNVAGDLEQLKNEGVDERYVAYHQLCYAIFKGDVDATDAAILKLIDFTGDDPIYTFLYGKALMNAHRFDDALLAFNAAKSQKITYFWDLWNAELECYAQLGNRETFQQCLNAGKNLYGMSDQDLAEHLANHFPKMK